MQLASIFGLAALCLALIGIYGVVSYSVEQRKPELGLRLALGANHVEQRKPELGLRLALGANHAELLALTMKYGLLPVLLGLGFGLLFSLATGSLVRGLIFGVSASDPVTMAGVSLLLIVTAATACLLPASRVVRLKPASILRHE